MTTRIVKAVSYYEKLAPVKLQTFKTYGNLRARDELKTSPLPQWLITKPCKMVTYNEQFPSIKSHDPLIA